MSTITLCSCIPQFWWNRYLPTKWVYDPRLVFSGITIFKVNPKTGQPEQLLVTVF
jgi:hypothetical protein